MILHMRGRRFAILAALSLCLSGCGESAGPLRIGTYVWPGYEPLYLARELGHLDPKTVHLVEYPSASEVIRAFRNQAIDGAALTLDELLLLAQDRFEPKVVLVMDVSHGGDVILGRPGMRELKDLSGRRVAVDTETVGAYLLTRALMVNGLQPSDVRVIHLAHNEHALAFNEGQVDAVVNAEPLRTELLAAGASLLFDSTQIPGEIVDVLAIGAEALAENHQALGELLRGWFLALEYLKREPQDAAARMSQREQVSAEQFLQSLRGMRIPSRSDNLKLLSGPDPALAKTGRGLMQIMLEQRLLKGAADIDALLAPAPLENLPP